MRNANLVKIGMSSVSLGVFFVLVVLFGVTSRGAYAQTGPAGYTQCTYGVGGNVCHLPSGYSSAMVTIGDNGVYQEPWPITSDWTCPSSFSGTLPDAVTTPGCFMTLDDPFADYGFFYYFDEAFCAYEGGTCQFTFDPSTHSGGGSIQYGTLTGLNFAQNSFSSGAAVYCDQSNFGYSEPLSSGDNICYVTYSNDQFAPNGYMACAEGDGSTCDVSNATDYVTILYGPERNGGGQYYTWTTAASTGTTFNCEDDTFSVTPVITGEDLGGFLCFFQSTKQNIYDTNSSLRMQKGFPPLLQRPAGHPQDALLAFLARKQRPTQGS